MATAAYLLLLLATLVALGRPPSRPTARELLHAAARGALVLGRLSDRRRARLLAAPQPADHGVGARRSRSTSPVRPATSP